MADLAGTEVRQVDVELEYADPGSGFKAARKLKGPNPKLSLAKVEAKSVLFEVEAWDGVRKIGDGTHRRGVVNVAEFESRFGVTKPEAAMS